MWQCGRKTYASKEQASLNELHKVAIHEFHGNCKKEQDFKPL